MPNPHACQNHRHIESGGPRDAQLRGSACSWSTEPLHVQKHGNAAGIERAITNWQEEQMREMKRFAIVGVCLAVVAVCATTLASAALASEPALYECAKAAKEGTKYLGKYTDKKCSKEATATEIAEGKKNKYELKEGFGKGKAFKGKGKGANLEMTLNVGVQCTSSSDSGKFTSSKTAGDIVVTFKGCEFNGKKCESASTPGTIVTNPLKGEVGYLAGKGTKTPIVGADITAESGEVLSTFKCTNPSGTDVLAVTGSTIGEVGPANKFTKEATFTFEESGVGVQKWTHFEGGPNDVLTAHVCTGFICPHPETEGATAQAAEQTVVVNKGEELMLKA